MKTKFKGTKGEWLIDDYSGQGSVIDIIVNINEDEDKQIAQVYSLSEMCYKEFQNEEHKANARLIAHAPNMLEVLQNIMKCYEEKGQLLSFDVSQVRKVLENALIEPCT